MKLKGKTLLGKTIVGEETGRTFGTIGDISFITESGELVSVIIATPTKHATDIDLQRDDTGRVLVPFSAVKSVGDFAIISEKEII